MVLGSLALQEPSCPSVAAKGHMTCAFFLQEDIAVKSDMTWLTWHTPDESCMDIYGYGTISGVGYTGTCFVRFEVGYLFIVSEGVAVDRSFSVARLEETQINNMTWHQDDTATCQLARNQVKVQPCCTMLPKVTTCYHHIYQHLPITGGPKNNKHVATSNRLNSGAQQQVHQGNEAGTSSANIKPCL